MTVVRPRDNEVIVRVVAAPPGLASFAGVVIATGRSEGLPGVGTRVACVGVVPESERAIVDGDHAVPLPPGVSWDQAVLAGAGAAAVQLVRDAGTGLGERLLVAGIDLVGELVVRVASAWGIRVVAIDADPARRAAAAGAGAEATCDPASAPGGFDAAILGAPLSLDRVRPQGRIVIRRDVPVALAPDATERDLRLNESSGPASGPLAYVRFPLAENVAAFLRLGVAPPPAPASAPAPPFPEAQAARDAFPRGASVIVIRAGARNVARFVQERSAVLLDLAAWLARSPLASVETTATDAVALLARFESGAVATLAVAAGAPAIRCEVFGAGVARAFDLAVPPEARNL